MKLAAFILTTLIAAPVFTFAAPETLIQNNPARPQLPEASLPAPVADDSRQPAREFICRSVNYNDFIRVYLTFTNGTAGDIEVLQVDGYLPITFVHRPFSVQPKTAGPLLVSEEDGSFRYQATLQLPDDYASLTEFQTPMVITRTSAAPIKSLLSCKIKQ